MTRSEVQRWMVGRDRPHFTKAGWSLEVDDDNPDLNDPIGDALRSLGREPSNPAAVSDSDLSPIPATSNYAFLLACRFHALVRVLSHYRSQATQGILNNRIEFGRRADGLYEELYGKDGKGGLKAEVDGAINALGTGGVFVGERITRNTIPPATCIPQRW